MIEKLCATCGDYIEEEDGDLCPECRIRPCETVALILIRLTMSCAARNVGIRTRSDHSDDGLLTQTQEFDDESESDKPRNMTSSLSKREKILRKPLSRRNRRLISLCRLYNAWSYCQGA